MNEFDMKKIYGLPIAIGAYGLASLLHFAHNAIYLRAYPNMPAWLTASGVGLAWMALTSLGVFGYWLYRSRSRTAGAYMLAVYGLLGFGGLDHYTRAPIAAHTVIMNATIAGEAMAAAALLWCLTTAAPPGP